jgi:hypothetical protein
MNLSLIRRLSQLFERDELLVADCRAALSGPPIAGLKGPRYKFS